MRSRLYEAAQAATNIHCALAEIDAELEDDDSKDNDSKDSYETYQSLKEYCDDVIVEIRNGDFEEAHKLLLCAIEICDKDSKFIKKYVIIDSYLRFAELSLRLLMS